MTPREIVKRTVRFQRPERLAWSFPEDLGYGTDFAGMGMTPSPDQRPSAGADEWGAVWHNIGVCRLGEVKDFPLKSWSDFDRLSVPDVREERRWRELPAQRAQAGEKFILASGVSLYERVHFLRGLENTWADIYENPAELGRLIDLLVEMNLYAITQFAAAGADGFIWCDDWGLQDRLMIAPAKWREIWKPRYARVYRACHDAGLLTFLHSCGYIIDILDDLIEAGLDVIQLDQQENMGVERLGERFRGRIAFWCPVDIQHTMCRGSPAEIRAYCRRLVRTLGTPEGGFLPKWYGDPQGAGHREDAVRAMCDEFLAVSREMYGR